MRRGRDLQAVTTTRGKDTSDLARSNARLGAVPVSHPHPYRPFSRRRHRVALRPRRRQSVRRRSTNDDDDSDRENGAREKRRGEEATQNGILSHTTCATDGRRRRKGGEGRRQAMTTAACTSLSLSLRGAGCALALVGVHAQKHASLPPSLLPSGPSLFWPLG